MKKVIVVGGGIGGLATAARLAKDGYSVTLLEKNDQIGGRARVYKEKGFAFDMGPSWYMMPDVFESFFSYFHKKPSDFYKLAKLDPHYKIYLQNGNTYSIASDNKKNYQLFEKAEGGAGNNLKKYLAESQHLYDFVISDLIYSNYKSLKPLLTKRLLSNIHKLKLFHTFDNDIRKFFKNSDLRKVLEFTTVFLGGSPYNTPAFYTLISHTDFNLKIWHPLGGIYKVIEALRSLCNTYNVDIHTGETVQKIDVKNGTTKSVTTNISSYDTDIVISNADYVHSETQLLDIPWQTYSADYWNKKTLSPTAFVIYLGVGKKFKDIKHHNFYFDDSWTSHFKEVFKKPDWPETPSYYVHVPTKTDPSLAPKGSEILYFLVPVAPGLQDSDKTRKVFTDKVISHFESIIKQPIKKHIQVEKIFSHRDFIHDYNSYQGTAFGLAHTLLQTAFLRPKNYSKKVRNLYYVGQYTSPGIGMPLCLISSEIVSKLVKKEHPL